MQPRQGALTQCCTHGEVVNIDGKLNKKKGFVGGQYTFSVTGLDICALEVSTVFPHVCGCVTLCLCR